MRKEDPLSFTVFVENMRNGIRQQTVLSLLRSVLRRCTNLMRRKLNKMFPQFTPATLSLSLHDENGILKNNNKLTHSCLVVASGLIN